MFLNNTITQEHFENINVIEFKEELYNFAKNFEFTKLNIDILKNEVTSSESFNERILELVCQNLGYSYDELISNLNFNKIEIENSDIKKLITEQELRIKHLLIEFTYELLPFYLIKISKKRGKYKIKDNIREDLIGILKDEIIKAQNIEDTLNTINETLDARKQKENYINVSKRISLKSNKLIAENAFLIGIIDEVQEEKLIKLIDNIIKDPLIWDNLYDTILVD